MTKRALTMTFAIFSTLLVAAVSPVFVMIATQASTHMPLDKLLHGWVIDNPLGTIAWQAESLVATFLIATCIIVNPNWTMPTKGVAIAILLICHSLVAWFLLYVRGMGGLHWWGP